MNKYRLTTNVNLFKKERISTPLGVEKLLSDLYILASPYEVRQGVRYYRDTNKLVSDSYSIVAINSNNNNSYYSSMGNCSKSLNISRSTIKKCLNSGKSFKGYVFVLNSSVSIRHYSTSLRRLVQGSLRTTDETSNDTPAQATEFEGGGVKKYANAYTEKLKIIKVFWPST